MTRAAIASALIAGHGTKGKKLIDQAFNESAFPECP
jgi:hypothetical protein